MKKKVIIGLGVLVAVILLGFAGIYLKMKNELEAGKDVIANHISVEGIDVSGMTAEDVMPLLEEKLAEYQAGKVILAREDEQADTTFGELGLHMTNAEEVIAEAFGYGKEGSVFECYRKVKNLEKEPLHLDVTYALDQAKTTDVVTLVSNGMGVAPQNASLTRENGAFVITKEVEGIQVNVETSVEKIVAYVNEAWEYTGEEKIELDSVSKTPEITSEQLAKVQDLLGSFSTSFTSGNDRAKNIANATSRINGTILMPGEEMSASGTMGERTQANGYLAAGTYVNGKVVDGIGGGVCQVSTTLYGAVLRAELEVTERHGHSMTVAYVKPAEDAAIADGYKDLKFKNNTENPIYIEGYVSGGTVTYNIYGAEYRADNRTIAFVSNTLSTTPSPVKFQESASAKLSVSKSESGHDGKSAELWKVIYEDGKEVDRVRVNSTSYISSATIYTVGTASSNKEASALVKNAIKSKDLSTIQSAVSQAKALEKAAEEVKKEAPEKAPEKTSEKKPDKKPETE